MTTRELNVYSRLVGTWERERTLSEHEIKRMSHEDQLFHFIQNGAPSNEQKQAQLELEDAGLSGADSRTGRYHDDGPEDWSEDIWR